MSARVICSSTLVSAKSHDRRRRVIIGDRSAPFVPTDPRPRSQSSPTIARDILTTRPTHPTPLSPRKIHPTPGFAAILGPETPPPLQCLTRAMSWNRSVLDYLYPDVGFFAIYRCQLSLVETARRQLSTNHRRSASSSEVPPSQFPPQLTQAGPSAARIRPPSVSPNFFLNFKTSFSYIFVSNGVYDAVLVLVCHDLEMTGFGVRDNRQSVQDYL